MLTFNRIFNYVLLIFLVSSKLQSQLPGCTDVLANNYNASATVNDGSCIYASTSLSPSVSFPLDSSMIESSGLIEWNGRLITHNDNDDIHLYSLDTLNGHVLSVDSLSAVINKDWEEISQDTLYLYIGDFGNNANGNRTDLHILRIQKSSLLIHSPIIDTIHFSYIDQTDFSSAGSNNTDFDCEAFVVSRDSIYLFTKQWISKQTKVYVLPKIPGTYQALPRSSYNVNGLITGATYLEDRQLLVLCGYSTLLQPFSYLLYDFADHDFFAGNKRKVNISLPFHQIEGIATSNGLKYYMSNEKFVQAPLINSPQQLHIFDFSALLNYYLSAAPSSIPDHNNQNELILYPNPSKDAIWLRFRQDIPAGKTYTISNAEGKLVKSGKLNANPQSIDTKGLANGNYTIIVDDQYRRSFFIENR